MKTRIIFLAGLLLLSLCIAGSRGATSASSTLPKNAIQIYASPDLYDLTTRWANQYRQVNSNVKIDVVKTSLDDWPGIAASGEAVGFFDDRANPEIISQGAWLLAVGHDVIVPVMNAKNPLLDEIRQKGISSAKLHLLSGIQGKANWQKLFPNGAGGSELPLHFYIMDDPDVLSGVDKFLKTSWTELGGTKISNNQEMISAIQNDPGAFGFCKLTQITGQNNQELAENIKLIPVDKNGNGKIDFMENIYSDLQTFSRGVWIGKYPKVLSGNIYAVSSGKPQNESEVAFLKWVLTDGQHVLSTSGYRELVYNERQSQMDKIGQPETLAVESSSPATAIVKIIILSLILFVVAGFILDRIFRRVRKSRETVPVPKSHFLPAFDEDSVVIPRGVYFDKTHTWAFMKKNGQVKVGIDDFLQHVTGPITRIDMKSSGEKIRKGEVLFTIVQVGKQLSVYSPISGTIATHNKELKSQSSLLNTAPYTNGWVYLIEPLNWLLEVQFLFVAERYKTWLSQEFIRLKDFISRAVKVSSPEYDLVVMQDGGALKDCVLSGLGPETWDDFQTEFIDQAN